MLEEVLDLDLWVALWADLADSDRLDLARTPFFLWLEVEQHGYRGRAELFSGFCWQALDRELCKPIPAPVLEDVRLLSDHDRHRAVSGPDWQRAVHKLPAEGCSFPALAQLAFAMQAQGQGAGQLRRERTEARSLLAPHPGEPVLRAGEALGLLDEGPGAAEVFFYHQLVQEYFAARRLAGEPDGSRLAVPWRPDEVEPSLAQTLAELPPAERLAELTSTGWEETTILGAALAQDPKAFVAAVAKVNLPLVGRCAAQPDEPPRGDERRPARPDRRRQGPRVARRPVRRAA